MFRHATVIRSLNRAFWQLANSGLRKRRTRLLFFERTRWRRGIALASAALALAAATPAGAVVLWSDLGATLVHESGAGNDILGGAVKRDETSSDTLYFKFHVDPLSDVGTEEYFAAFQLYEGADERLGVGNSLKAWAYSAYNTSEIGLSNKVSGDFDLRSSRPEPSAPHVFFPYELPRRGIENTIVFKVQYVAGSDDLVTVWLNPDLGPGATEGSQAESSTTPFRANASFNEIHIRHGGGGGGWTFSDMAIATSFGDFVNVGGSQTSGAGRSGLPLTFRVWQREQGLPQNSVRALAQTHDGYLWVGNDDGVARFDGVRFVSFGLREGLRGGSVRVLFEDSQHSLWIGAAGGLTRWQGNQFERFTVQDGLPSDSITCLAQDATGQLWIGTDAGLAIFQHGKARPLSAAEELKGKPITTLFRDRTGSIWVGATGSGVFQIKGGKLARLGDASVEGLLQDPHCLLEDREGRIWLGVGDDFVLCHDNGQWHRYRIPRHLARPYVSTLVEEPDGTIWAGSVSEGLFQFKSGKLTSLNASGGLPDNFVESLLVDREGNLWVGTGAGLTRLRHSNLSVFGQNEGLGYGPVQGLAEITPGVIWACKPNDGLYRCEGRSFSELTGGDSVRRLVDVNTLLMTRSDHCWIATARGVFRCKQPSTSGTDTDSSGLEGQNVISLAEARGGGLWAGTREGKLWRLQGSDWLPQKALSVIHPISSLAEAPDGTLWVGTEGGGLYRFKDTITAHLDRANGLLSSLIRTLYLDAEGVLWVGTAGGGLSRLAAEKLTTFTTREGLPDNTISQILEDDAGRLWLGSTRGIACVGKRELEDLAAGKVPVVYPQAYGRADGMPSEECTGGFCPAGLRTKSGLLWFPTLKGVVAAEPRRLSTELPPAPVALEEIIVDGLPADIQNAAAGRSGPSQTGAPGPAFASGLAGSSMASLRLRPGNHRLEFHYTGLSFSAPERVRFRHRLEGLDADWVEAGTRRTAFYGYVPAGEYRFRVTACNSDGVWNEAEAGVALTVLPFFWQAKWFLAIVALGLVTSVGGVARIVEKRKSQERVRHLEQERSLERERSRIAQDLHDDLGSSLTRISLLSDLVKADSGNPAQVEAQAGKISQSAMQTVRSLEEIVWALRPGSDSLQSLVEYIAHFATELFQGDAPKCRLDLPPDLPHRSLPPEMRHNIFLVVKEALTNGLKHSGASELLVRAKASARLLEVFVEDDGKGFEPADLPPGPGKRQGLGNMKRRAEVMGGTFTVESTPGQGTRVRLTVPFPDEGPRAG